MEELFNLTYKEEVEELKEEDDFEALGDEKYLNHPDMEARLYWAFCRPNGSCEAQIEDNEPLVSIMAFNHSKLNAFKRFSLLHRDVVEKVDLRVKIKNRTRMLFRSLIDDDFKELNKVLDIVPIFLDVAVDQLKNGRKWNDIFADEIEATIFLKRAHEYIDEDFKEALFYKLKDVSELSHDELKEHLEYLIQKKEQIDILILEHYKKEVEKWSNKSSLHLLQKMAIKKLVNELF
jgi:hypothetical protein